MFKIKLSKYFIFNGFKKKGKNNGILYVWINGEKMTSYNKMNFRTKKSVGISGFIVHPVINLFYSKIFYFKFILSFYFSSFSVVQV